MTKFPCNNALKFSIVRMCNILINRRSRSCCIAATSDTAEVSGKKSGAALQNWGVKSTPWVLSHKDTNKRINILRHMVLK